MKLSGVLDYHMEMYVLSGVNYILLLCCQPQNITDCCLELGVSEMAANCVSKVLSLSQLNCVQYELYVHIGWLQVTFDLSISKKKFTLSF